MQFMISLIKLFSTNVVLVTPTKNGYTLENIFYFKILCSDELCTIEHLSVLNFLF